MRTPTKRMSLVRDSIKTAREILGRMPLSPEVEELRQKADAMDAEISAWTARPPSAEEREKMMKRVLGLHVAVAKLSRRQPK